MKKTFQAPIAVLPKSAVVRSVLFQIIRECNFSCNHCSQAAPLVSREKPVIANLCDVRKTIRELKQRGLERVRFTGGEPLLHPQFTEILECSIDNEISISFVTNGSLLYKYAELEAMSNVESVWISLYGVNSLDYKLRSNRPVQLTSISNSTVILSKNNVKMCLYCPISLSYLPSSFELIDHLVDSGIRKIKFIQLMEQGRQLKSAYSTLGNNDLRVGLRLIKNLAMRNPHLEVNVSLRSGQVELFNDAGWIVSDELSCASGEPDNWSIGVDGDLHSCCLSMSNPKLNKINRSLLATEGMPVRFLENENIEKVNGEVEKNSCFALQAYNQVSPEKFVCPLKYARIYA